MSSERCIGYGRARGGFGWCGLGWGECALGGVWAGVEAERGRDALFLEGEVAVSEDSSKGRFWSSLKQMAYQINMRSHMM